MSALALYGKNLLRSSRADLAVLVLLAAVVFLAFHQTIIDGKSISRATNLTRRDTLYQQFSQGNGIAYDTCVYQEHTPNFLLVADMIRSGATPLWNPYAGLGCPLLSDTQTLLFSPITWITAGFAGMKTYNVIIVLNVLLAAAGAYGLARVLGFSWAPALLTAMCYAFSPYQLFMMEWTRCQSATFPLVFLTFAHLKRSPRYFSYLLATASAVLVVVSGHAVPALYCLAFASLFFLLLVVFDRTTRLKPSGAILLLAAVAAGTFLICAPLILPFLEAIGSSDCFKSEIARLRYVVPWQSLTFSLLYPFHGHGSPYPGAAALVLILLGIVTQCGRSPACLPALLTGAIAFATLTRLGPFDYVCGLPKINWFMTVYAMPVLMLMLSVIAGAGLALLTDGQERLKKWWIAVVVAGAAFFILFPLLIQVTQLPPSAMRLNDWLTSMSFSRSIWIREAILIGITGLSLLFLTSMSPFRRTAIAILILGINAFSMGMIAKKSMPTEFSFSYPPLEVLAPAKDNARIISMGRHVFVPNTNQIYKISNLVSFAPTHPEGMLTFLRMCGVTIEGVNQFADGALTPQIDLASVTHAISSEPVIASDDHLPPPAPLPGAEKGLTFSPEVKLRGAAFIYDKANQDIFGTLDWKTERDTKKRSTFCALICAPDGTVLWIGDQHPLSSSITATVPRRLSTGSQFKLVIQVLDSETAKLIVPNAVPHSYRMESMDSAVVLGSFTVARKESLTAVEKSVSSRKAKPEANPEAGVSGSRHFVLQEEDERTMARIYKNARSMPAAYFVSSSQSASSSDDALRKVSDASFQPRSQVVIEGGGEEVGDNAPKTAYRPHEIFPVALMRPDTNSITAEFEAPRDGWLVVTDAYFPGWKAKVNGETRSIKRANGVFRAVQVTRGTQKLMMRYEPDSLKLGLLLFCGGLFGILTCGLILVPRQYERRNEG